MRLGKIRFGELDAKHEVFAQAREGSFVLLNAFQIPPSVKFDSLMTGSKFFVSGLKGTGKTSLLLYLRHRLELENAATHVILFKSKLTDSERQRLSNIGGLSAFVDQNSLPLQYDYKQNWLWFIISELTRLIDPDDVVSGRDLLEDLRHLTGANDKARQSVFSGLQLTKIKAVVDNAIKAGPLTTSLKTEIEAIRSSKEQNFIDIVNMCENALSQVRVRSDRRVALFFDELELFANKVDQRDRDLHLIRDLLYAVSRINQSIGAENPEICVYAAVRSEVLFEINRVGPEIQRDVEDFGVSINWIGKSTADEVALLRIIEAKINQSEIDEGEPETIDIWSSYFPEPIAGKPPKQYLLDVSMYRPRTLVSLLSNAATNFPDATAIMDDYISQTESKFSAEMWREVEEELRTSFLPEEVQSIKSLLTGMKKFFTVEELAARATNSGASNPHIRKMLGTRPQCESLVRTLYRIGAIGNHFTEGAKRSAWVFRDHSEPQLSRKFMFHDSLRESLQLT